MTYPEKQALRKTPRARFPGGEDRRLASKKICGHVLRWSAYRQAQVIGGYLPLAWEADITPVLEDALRSGKTLLLPRVEGPRQMTLRRVDSLNRLVPGRWGLLEPSETAAIVSSSQVHLLLVPLEGVDERGNRLGKGGGYYDILLQETGAIALGVALPWQWVNSVPHDAWDKPLDACAAVEGIHVFAQRCERKGISDGEEDEEKEKG